MTHSKKLSTTDKNPKAFVVYVPVLHRGYLEFFDRYPMVRTLYVCGPSILQLEAYLRKDLRALSPTQQVEILRSLGRFDELELVEADGIAALASEYHLVLPNDDISRRITERLEDSQYELSPVFLRWDRQSVEAEVPGSDEVVTTEVFERTVMGEALQAADYSSDIWRRLGAVLITADGRRVGPMENRGEPTPYSPLAEGDPRNLFSQGVGIEMSVFTHAEACVIAEAARTGVALQGASIFVSTFPCPACAKLIARSGIAKCFYADGYAVLDGRRIMEDYGVQVVRVQMDKLGGEPDVAAVPYPPKSN